MPADDNVLRFETRAPGFETGDFFVQEMHAIEEISTPYEVELSLACRIDGGLGADAIDDILSAPASVAFGAHGTRQLHGVVTEVELLAMSSDGRWSAYRMIVAPRLWLTGLTRRSRCFVGMSFPKILRAVLDEMGLRDGDDYELKIDEGSYADNADRHVVQYEESDFNFLSRWLERLGVFYFFEQGDASEKIVFADSNAEVLDVPEYAQLGYSTHDSVVDLDAVCGLRRRTRRRPAKLHVRDYNWRAGAQTHVVHGNSDVDEKGFGLHAHYGDHFDTDAAGKALASVRAEEWMARKAVTSARSINPFLTPGHKFALTDSPMGDLDQDYLVTRVVHEASQDAEAPGRGDYHNRLLALDHARPFRPARRAPWPHISGVMHAKVDAGTSSSAAPIDDRGRYRVLLPYDLYGKYGKKPSRWIRKAESYSGPSYGQHFTLHVGAEVLLAHVNGDPDRPVIVGTVANDVMFNPLTDMNPTRSILRTRSGIMFDFEDDA